MTSLRRTNLVEWRPPSLLSELFNQSMEEWLISCFISPNTPKSPEMWNSVFILDKKKFNILQPSSLPLTISSWEQRFSFCVGYGYMLHQHSHVHVYFLFVLHRRRPAGGGKRVELTWVNCLWGFWGNHFKFSHIVSVLIVLNSLCSENNDTFSSNYFLTSSCSLLGFKMGSREI